MDIDHALVIGGTGMLRRATAVIAESARKLTVVARTRTSLDTLAKLLSDSESHRYETLDWNQPDHFVGELRHLVREVGHPSLVLAWLHDMNLGPRVAVAVSTPETPCDFFQVIGSSGDGPHGGAAAVREQVEAVTHIKYFQVVLGFKREAGASRWLTNDEISAGVLEAIRKREACRIVGTVTPWDRRP
jgi:hypothetical protein